MYIYIYIIAYYMYRIAYSIIMVYQYIVTNYSIQNWYLHAKSAVRWVHNFWWSCRLQLRPAPMERARRPLSNVLFLFSWDPILRKL